MNVIFELPWILSSLIKLFVNLGQSLISFVMKPWFCCWDMISCLPFLGLKIEPKLGRAILNHRELHLKIIRYYKSEGCSIHICRLTIYRWTFKRTFHIFCVTYFFLSIDNFYIQSWYFKNHYDFLNDSQQIFWIKRYWLWKFFTTDIPNTHTIM